MNVKDLRRSKYKKNLKGGFSIVLVLTTIAFSGLFLFPENLKFNNFNDVNLRFSYTFHQPINITSNDNFTTSDAVVSGSGILGDPWVIDNWELNASTLGVAISISDTTDYVTISTLNITGGSGVGIQLVNADNVEIKDILINNITTGISIGSSCTNITSLSNITVDVSGDGIRVLASNVKLNDVNVTAGGTGILLSGSSNTINGSVVEGTGGLGISITGSSNTVNNTQVSKSSSDAIRVTGNHNNMLNCTIFNSSQNGINIYGQNNLINESLLYNNTKSHIIIQTATASYNNITNNDLNDSITETAVRLVNAPDNLIKLNDIVNENGSNPSSHGIDITGASSIRNTLILNNISVNKTGVRLTSGSGQNEISNNSFITGYVAVSIQNSPTNTFLNNNISSGFSTGALITGSNDVTVRNNTFTDPGSNSSILVRNINSNRTIIDNNTLEGGMVGVQVDASIDVNAYNNTFMNFTKYGCEIQAAATSTVVKQNDIYNSTTGMGISIQGSYNEILENSIKIMPVGIDVSLITNNKTDNIIKTNRFLNCGNAGIIFDANTTSNLVFDNSFILNLVDVLDSNGTNQYDNVTMGEVNILGGPNVGGNFWDTYTDYDSNIDGFGNSPYNPSGTVLDNNPLVILPQVNSPHDNDYYQGLDGYVIPWVIAKVGTAPVAPRYEVLINGTSYQNGTWVNNTSVDIPIRHVDPAALYNYTIKYSYNISTNMQFGIEDMVWINLRSPDYSALPVNTSRVLNQYPADRLNITVQGNITSSNFYVEREDNVADLLFQIPGTPGSADGFNVRIAHNETATFSLNYSMSLGYNDGEIDDAQVSPYYWDDDADSWIDPTTIGASFTLNRTSNVMNLTMPSNTSLTGEFIFIGTPILDVSTDKTYYNNTENITISISWLNIINAVIDLQLNDSSNQQIFHNSTWGTTNSSGGYAGVLNISQISGLDNDNFTIYIVADNGTHVKTNWYYPSHFVVDSVSPVITIDSPTNGTYHNQLFWINTTINDPYLDTGSLAYYINSSRYAFNGNETINSIFDLLGDGEFNITVEAKDYSSNIANTSVTIFKDYLDPVINVTNPLNNSYQNAPFLIETSVVENNLDSLYYRIDSYVNGTYPFNGSELINTAAFNSLPEGNHFVVVYAVDLAGGIDSCRFDFVKDITLPFVNVTNPDPSLITNQTFSINTVIFDANPNASSMYYRIDSTVNGTYLFNGNETINTTAFNAMGEGIHTLYVYTVDLAGNVNYTSVTFTKDTVLPGISILSPSNNSYYNSTFTIEALNSDTHSDQMWYLVDGQGITDALIFNGNNWSAIMNSGDFAGLADGSYILKVYGNDTAGNVNETNITFTKDTILPGIQINMPVNFTYVNATFELNVSVTDVNYKQTWYTIDGLNPTIFEGNTTLAGFDSLSEAMHEIRVFASDLAGNVNSSTVNFTKDTSTPILVLEDPVDLSYQNSTFLLNVTVTDDNFNYSWYVVDGNVSWREFFVGAVNFSSTIFTALPEGSHSVVTYANDSAGNRGSVTFSFTKDTVIPDVAMLLPAVNGSYYNETFQYRISIFDINHDSSYYKIDSLNGSSTTFAANNTQVFLSGTFDGLSQGTHNIYFIAKDLAGNTNMTILAFVKDTILPVITIDSPLTNGSVYKDAFDLNTTITDANFVDDIWYQISGRSANTTFDGNDTLTEFNDLSDGTYDLYIYARDLAGNTNSTMLVFTKDTTAPDISLISPANNSYYNATFDLNITASDPHFSDVWYRVDGGAPVYAYTGNETFSGFGPLSQGWHEIELFANDSVGNFGSIILNFSKDTVLPLYTILNPSNNSYFNNVFDLNMTITEINLENIIMKVDNTGDAGTQISGNYTFNEFTSLSQGSHVIYLYINDKAGNTNTTTIAFTKDTILPVLVLVSPANSSIFNNAFDFVVNVTDINIDFSSYQVESQPTRVLSPNSSNSMIVADWNALSEGTNSIEIWCDDLAGNRQTIFLEFIKDTIAPNMQLVNPANNSYFNSSFEVETNITDIHIDNRWFNIDNGANNSFGGSENITFDFSGLGEGLHEIYIFGNDTGGNENSMIFSFTKDTINPNITITSPAQGQLFNSTFVINTSVVDATALSMYYYIDNMTMGPTVFNGNESLSGFAGLDDGSHEVMLFAQDAAGNVGAKNLTFIKDTIVPVITVIVPSNFTYHNSAFDLNVSITDLYFNETWYSIDGGSIVMFDGN
ncbi:MAG: right-handed parallel beta-helix repeat-containing protein, partial [Promethearchaeota archaeon]